jgi:hypothetical protein
MEECLDSMREEHKFATKELSDFKAKIKKAQVLFNMAKAANAMLEKSQSAQSEVFAQIKEQVSFDKVRTDLNRAFANMNTAIERRKNASFLTAKKVEPKAIEGVKQGEVIDLSRVGERITIKR